MAYRLHLRQTSLRILDGLGAMIRALVRAVAAEHTLAQRAATKAASPRQSVAEVRAMYVAPLEPHQESDGIVQSTRPASQTSASNSSSARARFLRAWRQSGTG